MIRPQRGEYSVNGVRVETYGAPSDSSPLLFVHGGCQGSWAWEKIATRMAENGWYAACLNWYGHNGSTTLQQRQALIRSLLDVTTEITAVSQSLNSPPVLVAHSVGAIPSLAYAADNPLAALVLITPVLPAGLGAEPVDLPVDPASMFMPPPTMIRSTWWDRATDGESERYKSLLVHESPRAVLEATRWLCEVELDRVHAPVLVIAGSADLLVPAVAVKSLADALDASFFLLEGEGHGVPLNPVWANVADRIHEWLSALGA